MVTYGKPYLTFEQQADLLCERGMQLNRDQALWAVEHIGYYRLSGYWYPYRLIDREASQAAGHVVRLSEVSPNTTLKQVLRLYTFDRRLKLLVMDAIERVEVALRVEIAYVLGGRNPNAPSPDRCTPQQPLHTAAARAGVATHRVAGKA